MSLRPKSAAPEKPFLPHVLCIALIPHPSVVTTTAPQTLNGSYSAQ
jgi:hypothetical protein